MSVDRSAGKEEERGERLGHAEKAIRFPRGSRLPPHASRLTPDPSHPAYPFLAGGSTETKKFFWKYETWLVVLSRTAMERRWAPERTTSFKSYG